jgi:hypothetical protein
VEPHRLQSIPCYAERSWESGGLFPLQNQSLLHRTQGIQWSPARRRGWHDGAAYLYAIFLYRDNGGAATDDTTKGCMGRVAGGGSTTSSRWLSNEGVCLCARRPLVRSTTRLGAFGVNRCRLRHRCVAISRAQAPAAAAAWKKDGFEFLCFAAKTVGWAVKWWSSHKELEISSSRLAFVWCSNYLCKILGEQQIWRG